jgi:hypothetical protein
LARTLPPLPATAAPEDEYSAADCGDRLPEAERALQELERLPDQGGVEPVQPIRLLDCRD